MDYYIVVLNNYIILEVLYFVYNIAIVWVVFFFFFFGVGRQVFC